MPERVTRAQAEAAVERLVATGAAGDNWFWERDGKFVATLRAYLAQRPDEETVRKGHKTLDAMSANLARWLPVDNREEWAEEDEAAVRAAMYHPEEEA